MNPIHGFTGVDLRDALTKCENVFARNPMDGIDIRLPVSVEDSDGNLYQIVGYGGNGEKSAEFCLTIKKIPEV